MKFSCAIFFFALTIAAQFQCLHAVPSDELFEFKRTLDEASNALQNVEESPALSGNDERQRQRRKSIDELLQNSKVDLRLSMQREALNSDHDLLQSLQGRAARNDYKSNKNEMSKKFNVNDQLNDLVRANSNFQNIHRKLLNTFHNSQTKLRMDDALQRERSSESKGNKAKSDSSGSGSSKEDKEKPTNKDKESNNNYNNANKNSQNNKNYKTGGGGGTSKDDTYNSNYNYNQNKDYNIDYGNRKDDTYKPNNVDWKSSLNSKDNFKTDFDFGKSDSFSKFDASDNFNSNANFESGKSGHKHSGPGSSVLTKTFISCKPVSKHTDNTLGEKNTYFEFTSNLHNPSPNKIAPAKGNLNTLLLLEANRNLHPKNMDNLEELDEKKIDPEMRRMMEKVEFPLLKLDFESQMEDFARSKSRSEYEDEDEPISYEKTIENIHFPSIVNDQFDLGRNDLSHEADYKLSKIEQEQSEPRRNRPLASERSDELLNMDNKLNIPWKRSAGFNAMDEIKLKTSTRLMAKGLGPSLPSYALSETQHELQLDEAVKNLEQNIAMPRQSEIGELIDSNEYTRPNLRIPEEQRDWQERLNRMEAAEERTYEKLLYDSDVETPSAENDPKGKTEDDVIIKPTYSILRRRRKSEPPNEEGKSKLSTSVRTKRVSKAQHEDVEEVLRQVSKTSPEDILVMQIPDLASVSSDEPATANEVSAPEVPTAEEPPQDDSVSDEADAEKVNEVDDAQLVEDSEQLAEQSADSEVSKRCGEQDAGSKTNDEKSTRDKDNDVKHDMTIFKFKRDADNVQGSNDSKRRVKRIGVINTDGEFSGVREVDPDSLMDLMTIRKLKLKREVKEREDVGVAEDKRARRTSDVEKPVESELSKQNVLRRRRRDVAMANPEVFNDEPDGIERKRRSLNEKAESRIRREVDKVKENEEKKEKEKAKENDEAKKNKPIDDEKENEKKLMVNEERSAKSVEHLMDKRYAHTADTVDDNNGDARKFLNAALMMGNTRNSLQLGDSGDSASRQREEALDDAAVIAADREAMNAARYAYPRNADRAANYMDGREDKYGNLIERLRRLPFRNRDPEQEQQTDLGKTVSEFGNQKFDNLKQSDQYSRNFDGVPIDNLWYGRDPWDEGADSNNVQAKNEENEKNERKKNRPNPQHSALTINIEDGVIKSVERKESPSRENEVGVANEKMGIGEDEDYGAGEDPALGWFSKSKGKESNDRKCKDEDNGMVLKLDDQLLNCTAFSTLESFLKSVQQNKDSDGMGSGNGNTKGKTETNSDRGADNISNKEGGGVGHSNDKKGNNNCAGDDGRGGQVGSGGSGNGAGVGGSSGNGSQGKSGHGGVGEIGNNSQRKPGGSDENHGDTKKGGSNDGTGKDTHGNSSANTNNGAINMTIEIQPVTIRPLGSGNESRKAMKLNITINASVMGDQKAKNFFGNGTFKVQSEDRERRGVAFPEFDQVQRYTRRRKCPKAKPTCDESTVNGKGALQIVKSMFNMAKCNPQMKPLWSVLKRNQQCMKKIPPPDNSFEKMQKDDINHIEDMVAQAMEAISNIIDDQVQQRSCIPLPPELKIFYDQILEIYESNSAEGVREKRANIDAPFNEFSKEVRLIDPNRVEERARVVKKLLRQYDDLSLEDQQQMVGLRDDLLQDLDFLERVREEQNQKEKREQMKQQTQPAEQPQQDQQTQQEEQAQQEQQVQREQQLTQEQAHQPEVPQLHTESKEETEADKEPEADNDEQSRRRREVLQQLEAGKEDDEALIKAYNLPYTPEYLRLLKASELMEEQEIRENERNEKN